MNRFRLRSFCRASGNLFNKPIFSLPNGKTQKGVISKHNQVQVKYYLTILKSESISVRIQKKRKRCASNFCGGSTDLELQIIDMDPQVSKLCFWKLVKSVRSIKIGSILGPSVGRSLCRRRPVSVPASAGLYAGIGRGLYAGVGRS